MDEDLNKTLLNQMPESMIVLDERDKIMFFNDIAAELQKLARKPFERGTDFVDVVSPERKEIVQHILRQVRTRKVAQVSEAEYKDEAGKSYFFEVTYSPVQIDKEGGLQIWVISHEITHHKTFEKKSIQLLADLSSLIENAKALIFSVDSRKYITEWNQECVRVTQYDKNDILARKVTTVVDPADHKDFEAVIALALAGDAVTNKEFVIRTKNNESLTVLVNATPKLSSTKQVVGVLFVGQDITELTEYRRVLEEKVKDRTENLKRALEKEKELVEMKNRFVSVASHEFRIPLSTIDSSVLALKNNKNLTADEVQKLSSIETQVGYMKGLLDDVLTLKKSEGNKLIANLREVNLTDFLKNISGEVLSGSNRTHRIDIRGLDGKISIQSDDKLLRNIFLNLLSNAIKFSPGKDEVLLEVSNRTNGVTIRIVDYGIGIPEQDRDRIFEPFNRGENASEIKGTGLGLSIVKRAVEALGGRLEMESTIGIGTTFTVTFSK